MLARFDERDVYYKSNCYITSHHTYLYYKKRKREYREQREKRRKRELGRSMSGGGGRPLSLTIPMGCFYYYFQIKMNKTAKEKQSNSS
jgi:hypothetical protein